MTCAAFLARTVQEPPDQVADALVDAGVRLFTVGVGGPDYDLDRLRQWLRWRDAQQSTA